MRKSFFGISLLVMAALVLSACGAPTAAAPTIVPGIGTGTVAAPVTGNTTGTAPAVNGTVAPLVTQTGAAGGAGTGNTTASQTGTPAAGSAPAASTATVPAAAPGAATATTAGQGSVQTGTPAASTTSAARFVQLSTLLQANVNSNDNQLAGTTDGVLVERPVIAAGSASAAPNAQNGVYLRYVVVNVAKGSANAVAVPTATESSGVMSGGGAVSNGVNGNEVLIPWQAFNLNNVASTAVNNTASAQSPQTLTLNVGSQVIASAPRTTLDAVSNGTGDLLAQADPFWASQTPSIPATGNSTGQPGSLAFIPRQNSGISVTDLKNNQIGKATDLLVNASTGEVTYAVFNGGPSLNNRLFVLPIRNLTWVLDQGAANASNLGSFTLNIPSNLLNNAPSFNNLNQIPLDQNLVNQLNQFWQNVGK